MNYRIGHGYDVHALAADLPLIVGGIEIESDRGCVAHSDGDVVAHAICDALLGSLAMGDIGLHFPDTDPEYKGADSMILLERVCQMIRERGYEIENIDSTVVLQQPKLRPYIESMRDRIADSCRISTNRVSVKATTEEHLGFTGSGEGIAAHAVVLLYRIKRKPSGVLNLDISGQGML